MGVAGAAAAEQCVRESLKSPLNTRAQSGLELGLGLSRGHPHHRAHGPGRQAIRVCVLGTPSGTKLGVSLAGFRGSHFPRKGPIAVIRLAMGGHPMANMSQLPTSCPSTQAHRHSARAVGGYPRHPYAQDSTEAQDGVWGHSCTHQSAGHTDKGPRPTDQPAPKSQGDRSQHRGTPEQRLRVAAG